MDAALKALPNYKAGSSRQSFAPDSQLGAASSSAPPQRRLPVADEADITDFYRPPVGAPSFPMAQPLSSSAPMCGRTNSVSDLSNSHSSS